MTFDNSQKKNKKTDPFRDSDSNNFYRALLDDLITFVSVLDKDGTVLLCNNSPLIIGGLKLEDVLGKKFYDAAWFSLTRDGIMHDIKQCAAGKKPCVRFNIWHTMEA